MHNLTLNNYCCDLKAHIIFCYTTKHFTVSLSILRFTSRIHTDTSTKQAIITLVHTTFRHISISSACIPPKQTKIRNEVTKHSSNISDSQSNQPTDQPVN